MLSLVEQLGQCTIVNIPARSNEDFTVFANKLEAEGFNPYESVQNFNHRLESSTALTAAENSLTAIMRAILGKKMEEVLPREIVLAIHAIRDGKAGSAVLLHNMPVGTSAKYTHQYYGLPA